MTVSVYTWTNYSKSGCFAQQLADGNYQYGPVLYNIKMSNVASGTLFYLPSDLPQGMYALSGMLSKSATDDGVFYFTYGLIIYNGSTVTSGKGISYQKIAVNGWDNSSGQTLSSFYLKTISNGQVNLTLTSIFPVNYGS
jgi:hypothetical protein